MSPVRHGFCRTCGGDVVFEGTPEQIISCKGFQNRQISERNDIDKFRPVKITTIPAKPGSARVSIYDNNSKADGDRG